jgi:L-lactate utilization protein LutB
VTGAEEVVKSKSLTTEETKKLNEALHERKPTKGAPDGATI